MKRDAKQILTESLVLAAQAGSETAFRGLHELWTPDFRRLILARVERPSAVDEIASDVWLAVARGIHVLDDPACFPRWAFRILERRSVDWIRAQTAARQRNAAIESEATQLAPALPAKEASDESLRLGEAIARLPAEERELLQLYYGLERSVAEIGEILDVPPGTVKSRLFSLREKLKQTLERKLS